MSSGLRVYDKNGSLILDATSRPPKLLGVIEDIKAAGSFKVIKPDNSGDVWFYTQAVQPYGAGRAIPIVTVTNDVISWRFTVSYWIFPATVNIFYGVY